MSFYDWKKMKIKKFFIKLIPNKRLKHKYLLKLQVHGTNNEIIGEIPHKLNYKIYGNNNKIIFGKNTSGFTGNILIGTSDCFINNCCVEIGDNSAAFDSEIRLLEDNSFVKIGKNCMLSFGIKIWCSDTHSILNMDNKVTNIGKSIEIGNHVWIGADVKISKNVKTSDDSIVGWGSVVTKQFEKTNVIIAGNPAKVVKENINWNKKRPQQILNDRTEK